MFIGDFVEYYDYLNIMKNLEEVEVLEDGKVMWRRDNMIVMFYMKYKEVVVEMWKMEV